MPASDQPPASDAPQQASDERLGGRATKSSLWTVLGFGLSQVFRLGSNVVLTRILPPTAFGLMALVGVVIQFLQQFSDMGIRPSIVRSTRGKDPVFLNTAWTLQVLRGSSLWGIALLLAWPVSVFYREQVLVFLLPVVGVTAMFQGLMSTSMATQNRDLAMGRLTLLELTSQLLGIGVMISWALISPTVWALAAGAVVNVGSALLLSHTILPGIRNCFAWEPEARKELLGFGRWIFLSTGFAFVMNQGDRMILSTFVPMGVLGIYSAAAQLSAAASTLLGAVSMKVLMPLYSRLHEQGPEPLRAGVFKARLAMMAATFPIPALLVPFGDILVRILLGPDFHEAGWMLQLLAVGAVVEALMVTAWPVVLAAGDSARYMVQVVAQMVLVTGGMLIGLFVGDVTGLIIGLAAGRFVGYPVLVWSIWKTRTWFPLLDLGALAYAGILMGIGHVVLGWVEPLLLPFVAK